MRNHAPFSDLLNSLLVNESSDSMESPTDFECAYALEVFAFKEQFDLRPRWLLSFPLCALECFSRLRCRGEVRERSVCLDWCEVDVWLDELVCCDDGVARQGKGAVEGAHDGLWCIVLRKAACIVECAGKSWWIEC